MLVFLLGDQVVTVGLNDYEDFFWVPIPAPSQKPLLMSRTSPKTVRTFSENTEPRLRASFSRRRQNSHGLSPSGHA